MRQNLIHRSIGVIPLIYAASSATTQAIEIHKCTEPDGRTVYRDRQCPAETTEQRATGLTTKLTLQDKSPALWKIVTGKGTAYLLGTTHFGDQETFPMPKVLTDVIKQTDAIAVEGFLSEVPEVIPATTALKSPNKLEFSSELLQRLAQMEGRLGLQTGTFANGTPLQIRLKLYWTTVRSAGFDPQYSIENAILKDFQLSKPILSFNTPEAQKVTFEGLPKAVQEASIVHTLDAIQGGSESVRDFFTRYRTGLDTVDVRFQTFDAVPKAAEPAFLEENTAIVDKILELTNDGRTYFFIVSINRLINKNSIVDMLRSKGYGVAREI